MALIACVISIISEILQISFCQLPEEIVCMIIHIGFHLKNKQTTASSYPSENQNKTKKKYYLKKTPKEAKQFEHWLDSCF